MRVGLGTGIAPPATHPATAPRVHPRTELPSTRQRTTVPRGLKLVVGLKSVDQLTLGLLFSDIRGMTEVYNLVIAEDPNDHKCIPGID